MEHFESGAASPPPEETRSGGIGSPPEPPHPEAETPARSKPKEKADEKKPKKKKKKKEKDSGRGVETMFRTSYGTHLGLSAQADTKANIMISINGLIISVLLATSHPLILRDRWALLPSAILLLTCLISLIFALMAARPRITRKRVSLEDVRGNRGNILFFGTFVNMAEDDYVNGMWELMEDRKRAYTNMMRDLYGLGRVLQAKYHLLRVSYTVFMIGLILGVAAFLLVYLVLGPSPQGI